VPQFEIIIFICSLFNDALSVTKTIQRRMKGWYVNCELEGSGRRLILRNYPGIRQEGLRKTTKTSDRMASRLAEMWKRDLPNTKQEC
jgi:hypothetical protein